MAYEPIERPYCFVNAIDILSRTSPVSTYLQSCLRVYPSVQVICIGDCTPSWVKEALPGIPVYPKEGSMPKGSLRVKADRYHLHPEPLDFFDGKQWIKGQRPISRRKVPPGLSCTALCNKISNTLFNFSSLCFPSSYPKSLVTYALCLRAFKDGFGEYHRDDAKNGGAVPELSVVVISRNQGYAIEPMVTTLKRDLPGAEIIFVLDRCTDSSRDLLKKSNTTFIDNHDGEGFGAPLARNLGALHASRENILFLDGNRIPIGLSVSLIREALSLYNTCLLWSQEHRKWFTSKFSSNPVFNNTNDNHFYTNGVLFSKRSLDFLRYTRNLPGIHDPIFYGRYGEEDIHTGYLLAQAGFTCGGFPLKAYQLSTIFYKQDRKTDKNVSLIKRKSLQLLEEKKTSVPITNPSQFIKQVSLKKGFIDTTKWPIHLIFLRDTSPLSKSLMSSALTEMEKVFPANIKVSLSEHVLEFDKEITGVPFSSLENARVLVLDLRKAQSTSPETYTSWVNLHIYQLITRFNECAALLCLNDLLFTHSMERDPWIPSWWGLIQNGVLHRNRPLCIKDLPSMLSSQTPLNEKSYLVSYNTVDSPPD